VFIVTDIFSYQGMLLLLLHLLLGWHVWLVLTSVQSFWLPLLNVLRYKLQTNKLKFKNQFCNFFLLVSLSGFCFFSRSSFAQCFRNYKSYNLHIFSGQDEYNKEDNLSLRNLTLLLSYLCIFGVCSRWVNWIASII